MIGSQITRPEKSCLVSRLLFFFFCLPFIVLIKIYHPFNTVFVSKTTKI